MGNFVREESSSLFVSNQLASAPTLKVVSLADNNDTPSGYDSGAIKVMGLLSLVFLIGVSFFCIRRRLSVEEGSRVSQQAGANNNLKGLEREVIESFPVFSYGLVKGLKSQAKGSECTVCLSDFREEEMVRLLPKCSHAFHPECIDMWLCSHTTCPLCRISLVPGEDSDFPTATAEPRTTTEQISIVVENRNNEAPAETSNHSTGHSLVMVRPREWCIATPRGVTPGLQRSCSFVANHHSQGASPVNGPPSHFKTGGSVADGGCKKSWGNHISMKSGAFLSNFTEQWSHKGHVRRTLSWVMVGEAERVGTENRSTSTASGNALQLAGTSTVSSSEKVKGILRFKSL